MRTNVVIDDELLAKAMQISKLPTKRAVIEAGLQALIRLKAQENIRSLRGKLHWEGDLEAMRSDYPTEPEKERRTGAVEVLHEAKAIGISTVSKEREVTYGNNPATQETE